MVGFECVFGDRASIFGVIFALISRPNKLPVGACLSSSLSLGLVPGWRRGNAEGNLWIGEATTSNRRPSGRITWTQR